MEHGRIHVFRRSAGLAARVVGGGWGWDYCAEFEPETRRFQPGTRHFRRVFPKLGGGDWRTRKSRLVFPRFWLPRNTQGNTLGSLLGRRGRWDTDPAPVHGLRSPGRGWLSRAGGGEAAARGRSRGEAPTGGCPAAPPWCDNLGSSSSSSSSPCRSYLRERSVSPASRTHDAHVVRWRSPPLPPPSRLSDAAASQLERGLPHAPKGGCGTRRRRLMECMGAGCRLV